MVKIRIYFGLDVPLIRRLLPLVLLALLLAPVASVATAQTSGTVSVSLTNQFIVTSLGFGVVNETVAFINNGTSTLQIPSVQVGIPDTVASLSAGWLVTSSSSSQNFTQTNTNNGNVTTFTLTPSPGTLAGGASVSVSLKSYLSNVFNLTTPTSASLPGVFLLTPSLNTEVTTVDSEIAIPTDGSISPVPTGYTQESGVPGVVYSNTTRNVTPAISTATLEFSDTSNTNWEPMQVYSVVSTIVPSSSASPQVEDTISLRNLANYTVSDIPLVFLASGLTQATVVPVTGTPTIDPTLVNITGGVLDVSEDPYQTYIAPGDNFTFGIIYSLPSSYYSTSGTTVSLSIPYKLPIDAIVQNFTITTGSAAGISPTGKSSVYLSGATPFSQGTAYLKYNVNLGWGAAQAVPIAALIFGVSFVALGLTGRSKAATKEEEEEEVDELGDRLADMIKAFEDKISLFQQFEGDMEGKGQGTVSRAEFNKIKNEMDSLRSRASGRLNALKQAAGSQRYQDLLNQVQEASREEDRTAKDLLNLYDQYQSRRMRDETFKRLLPTYKKRSDSAVNHLSDLLNLAQREGKQG